MNIKKIGLWGLFCFFSLTINSQTNIKENKKVEWLKPITINYNGETITSLQFSNMGDLSPETDIPLLSESIKLPTTGKPENIKISVDNTKYIWPTPEEHTLFKDKIKDTELKSNFSISRNGENYFLDISITPVIKPKDAQTFKKLSSYTLIISYNNNQNINSLKSEPNTPTYTVNSVLNSGKWVKVSVNKSGIHKISYSKLKEWGVSNPQNVAVYGNGGKMLPASNDDFRNDDLVENAIMNNESDNAIYFYAEGPVVWEYNASLGIFIHEKNNFSNYSYYFITEKNSASLELKDSDLQSETSNQEVNYFNDYDYHEEDNFNLIKSGNVWFGEKFDYYSNKSRNYSFNFPNIQNASITKAYIKLAARSGSRTSFELLVNDFLITRTYISSIEPSIHTSYYAREGTLNGSFSNSSDDIDLTVNFDISNSQSSSIGYLNYICLNVKRELKFVNNELLFRNIDVVERGNSAKYLLNNGQGLTIWDITNPLIPQNVNSVMLGSSATFNYDASELKEFVAFNTSGSFPAPDFVENVTNQNLHASPFVDYIIVCHPDFLEQANTLGQIHNDYNGMTYTAVTTASIYNEFSSGKPDVTAIRSFVRMLYDKAGTTANKRPKNLLLFGDGSYDNRQGIADNTNKIPTYQSDNSIHSINSFVSDDYFGLLDNDEGSRIQSEKVDIGIGRFPVNTVKEAVNAVNKTYKYYHNQSNDQWKNTLTFVADDGDSNTHIEDADGLTVKLEKNHPEYNISKLYFDTYEKITTTTGHSIPEIEEDITNAIANGTLVFNYTGHGGPTVLAHERVITKSHIKNWNNIDKLPLFVTATCEFSRYDDKELTSAGEEVFLNPLGGGIGLFTTTRIVYANLNEKLNTSFYNFAFEKDNNANHYTLGEIMMHTKNGLAAGINKLNFSLLGDPAIRLIYPNYNVNTIKINDVATKKIINNQEFKNDVDSLKALGKVKIYGDIKNSLNQIKTDFNGDIVISVFDKQSQITTRGNDGQTPYSYEDFDNIIFKGPASVINGEFEAEFIIPKDIRYNFDNGKISYYAFSDDNQGEAFGAFSDIIVGGINENAINDQKGPEIKLWLNSKNFSSGGLVNPRPILMAEISDESGINTTGSGIGHDITCVIDEQMSDPIILNNDFAADINSFQKGSLNRQLATLESGAHSLTVKAWDTYNNSSTSTLHFNVSNTEGLDISEPTVFPNPVTIAQPSYISFKHDDPNARLSISILLFNMSGQLISQQNSAVVSLLNTIPPIEINAETNDGYALNPGIYLYKLIITSQTGKKGEISGKIMVNQ